MLGTLVQLPKEGANDGVVFSLSHTVLEGHRICGVKEGIKKGEFLLSWGLPFGIALRDIQLGMLLRHCARHILFNIIKYTFLL